ncbi:MAG: heavy-metal-associated domain-containing protein [Candidatus Ryanbacteria bacterium]|nr:heavy-metal-associated domain-containing protein [Candidatus Ryanbacteria bacterium]
MAIVKKQFDVGGMHCGSCAAGIQMVLSTQDGIKNAAVSWDNKSGEVEFDDSKVTVEQIQKSVAELGYSATPK